MKHIFIITFMILTLQSWSQNLPIHSNEKIVDTNVVLIAASENKKDTTYYRYFEVEVTNLGPNKNILIHHHMQADCWYDFKLKYSHTTDNKTEIWKGKFTETKDLAFSNEFVIKYEVNDTAYWDNNQNKNYSIIRSNRQ